MFLWLDHLIFGNGHGMKTPYHDGVFYWLGGRLYTWIGGLGAQLQSTQWTHPVPGEVRALAGRKFRVFNSYRRGLRVSTSWALVDLPLGIDEAHYEIRAFKAELQKL